jgi:hypothetical protein
MNASLAMIAGLNQAYETHEDREWPRVLLIAAALAVAVIGLVFGTLVAAHFGAIGFGAARGASRTLVQWMAVVSILTMFVRTVLPVRTEPKNTQVGVEPSWSRRRRATLDDRNHRITHLLQPLLFVPRGLWPGRARGNAPVMALLDERSGPDWRRVEFRNRKKRVRRLAPKAGCGATWPATPTSEHRRAHRA